MAQPGRTVVRQDRARRHRTRRLHFGARSQKKTHAIHPPVQQAAQTREVEILRHVTRNYYRINRYSPLATATADGLRLVGSALSDRGGIEAMQLRIGEEYVRQFGKMAKESTTLVVPSQLSDLAAVVSMATSIVRKPPSAPASGATARTDGPKT